MLDNFRSSTTPRNKSKTSPKNRYKSSENILEKVKQSKVGNLSEGELLEDKSSIFDFTSNRGKQSAFDYLLNKKDNKNEAQQQAEVPVDKPIVETPTTKNDSNSDKSHEPFGSTEFPTLKRNLKLSNAVENEYESMTSIRNSVWTPTETAGKTIDGLSSPSVIVQDKEAGSKEEETPIEPPPNFAEKPPPLPAKKYTIKQNKHETQFHATLQRSSKSPKMEAKKSNGEKVIIQPNQVRMASLQAAEEMKQRQQRSKRIRNRSLEMVLDENRSSDSSPSRKR